MNTILVCLGALAGLFLLRRLLAHLILSGKSGAVGRAIGTAAMKRQPDTIRLLACGEDGWQDPDPAAGVASSLQSLGFQDAGTYRVPELSGLTIQLMANPSDCQYAAIYEHPKAGHWFDVYSHFTDGTSFTCTTARPTGLDPRPGHDSVNLPGARPQALCERVRAESSSRHAKPATRDNAVRAFETAYEEATAWRKQKGISAEEVGKVAARRKAA
jgi:hypothetical protein